MQKLQLSIPEPCHENWQQMTPTEQGRFCNACAKEVIDFSSMTDIQVLNYFTNLPHEKVCGRALPEQLDRAISRPEQPKKRLFWYWNYIVMFFMFFGKSNQLSAQRKARTTNLSPQVITIAELNTIRSSNINVLAGKVGEVKSDSRVISGKINDVDGNPISFASIKIKETNRGVNADASGNYSVRIMPGAVLEIFAAGFKPKEITAGNQTAFSITMEKDSNQIIVVTQGASCFGAKPRKAIPPAQNIKGDMEVRILGQTRIGAVNTDSFYVIDGVNATKAKADNLNPYDISDIIRLEKSEAVALFGNEASNGAAIITTRKLKEIQLKDVVVVTEFGIKGRMAGGISFTNIYEGSFLGDTIATVKTLLTDSIKVYPNPVQRNTGFSVAMQLKQAGNYSLQFSEASGRILLHKKFNASSKIHTEKLMSDSRWAGGVYYLRVFDSKNKLVSKSSFIVQ